jgi:hypothetical protein
MEPVRQRQDQCQLHQLARLPLHAAEIDPALGALAGVPHLQHQDQQHDAAGVGQPGQLGDEADVDQRYRQHQRQAEAETQDMPGCIGIRRSAGRRIQRRVADSGQSAQQQHVDPTDLPQLGGEAV